MGLLLKIVKAYRNPSVPADISGSSPQSGETAAGNLASIVESLLHEPSPQTADQPAGETSALAKTEQEATAARDEKWSAAFMDLQDTAQTLLRLRQNTCRTSRAIQALREKIQVTDEFRRMNTPEPNEFAKTLRELQDALLEKQKWLDLHAQELEEAHRSLERVEKKLRSICE